MPNPEIIKYKVGLAMVQKGYRTFKALAEACDISLPFLSNVLACRERGISAQRKIARACGVPASELFGEFTHLDLKELA